MAQIVPQTNQVPPAAQQQQIQIKMTDEVLRGVYANMAQISHNQEEFILDFMNIFFGQKQGVVTSRVIVSPGHMKRIAAAMTENIKRYEEKFGAIPDNTQNQDASFGFRTE